jgi:hypothetical protein
MSSKRILVLAVAMVLAVAAVAPTLAATPGSRLTTIQLTFNVETAEETFVGSGPGICSSGRGTDQSIAYIEVGESFKILMTKWLRCDDASGDLQIELSAGEPLGSQTRSGGWVVIAGTGVYERAVGGGTLSAKGHYPNDALGVDTMTGVVVP